MSIASSLRAGLARWGLAVATVLLLGSGVAQADPKDDKAKPPTAKPPAAKAPATPPTKPADVPPIDEPPPLTFHNESLIERADGTISYFYRSNFATPKDLIAALTAGGFNQLLGPVPKGVKGNLREVSGQNVLVIDGEPDGVEMVLDALAYFDIAAPQVFVEAKVIEVTYDSNFEFGVAYDWNRNEIGPNTLFRGTNSVLNPSSFLRGKFPAEVPVPGKRTALRPRGQEGRQVGCHGHRGAGPADQRQGRGALQAVDHRDPGHRGQGRDHRASARRRSWRKRGATTRRSARHRSSRA